MGKSHFGLKASHSSLTNTKNEVAGIQIRKPSRIKLINKSKYLYALIALPVVYYIVFHYAPMYGSQTGKQGTFNESILIAIAIK